MNLIPAETYVECLFGRTSQGSNPIDQAERDGRIKAIRQIQADALSYAACFLARKAMDSNFSPVFKALALEADALMVQANQLDPQPPTP